MGEYHYTSDSDWQHEDGKPDVSDGQAVLDGNVMDFKDAFPDGICGQSFFNFDQDVRTYCKFVHPGTELVHNGYTGGWWGSERKVMTRLLAASTWASSILRVLGTPTVMERGIRWTISGAQPLVHGQDH